MSSAPAPVYLRQNHLSVLNLLFIIVVAAAIVQIFFMVFLARGICKARERGSALSDIQPPVSVLICARNEEHNLRRLLPLILNQNYPEFEVVVVDDRSDDGTYDYLLELSRLDKRVRLVRVNDVPAHVNSKKYALTLGIKAAAYDWLLLTDADCRPLSDKWIRAMSRHMTDDAQFVLGCSPYERRPGMLNRFIRFETLYTAVQYVGLAGNKLPYMGVGRNLAYRKSFFLSNKGFNGLLKLTGGDDDLWVNRHAQWRNTRVCTGGECGVISEPKTTWREFVQQKKRHLMAGKYYRKKDKIVLGTLTASHLAVWTGGIVLLLSGFQSAPVAVLLAIRSGGFTWLMTHASRKLGFTCDTFMVPILDFLYLFYYLTLAPRALVAKRVKWKN